MPTTIDKASSGHDGLVNVGDTFPSIELTDHAGHPWRSNEVLGRPLVLILHRHLA